MMLWVLIGMVIVLVIVVLYGPQPPQPPSNTGPWYSGDPTAW